MTRRSVSPWLGAAAAVAVTATMDATGLGMFSALPLLVLTGLFWWWNRPARAAMGLRWGRPADYAWAVGYPLVAVGLLALAARGAGAWGPDPVDWRDTAADFALMASTGILGTLLTEEGFFRGWLRAAWRERGAGPTRTLLLTSGVFVLWHLSAVTLMDEYSLPVAQIPVYVINAFLLGMAWGLLRESSGSILVPSVCHAVWNGLAYELFAFGTGAGALGIESAWLYGPERGVLGILVNGIAVGWLWRRR